MVRRFALLSPWQLKVLQWVADDCPDGVWDDFTYKKTVYALADRKLVVVDRRRKSWKASITDAGRYYLQHDRYPPEDQPSQAAKRGRRSSKKPPAPPAVPGVVSLSPEDLLAEVTAAGSTLTLPNPAHGLRAAYRSAISRAISDGLVPQGYMLRHKSRDRGDLIIRLVSQHDATPPPEPLAPITMPTSLAGCHQAVRAVRESPQTLMDVSPQSRQRALLILQAIACECGQRGHDFALRQDGKPTFQITIGDDLFAFELSEEYERREVVDNDRLAPVKYDWQRVPSVVRDVPSGHLKLRLGDRYDTTFWADRKRWKLDDKLPAMFQVIEDRASAMAEARAQARAIRQERHQQWEQAVPRARQLYVDEYNRDRLNLQVLASAQAQTIRAYCERLNHLAASCDDLGLAEQIRGWAQWARQESDRTDPLNHLPSLTCVEPPDPRPSDIDKFMPKGMTSWHPPD